MPGSKSFEQPHEVPLQSKVDFKSVLEKGEITSAETLKGYFPIQIVRIKDDGNALFRPDSEDRGLRYDLEILASRIDEILEFNLVPPVTFRNLEGNNGSMQRFVEDAKPAASLGEDWVSLVDSGELIKAAVFDYLVGASDRHRGNFLINSKTGKIWLIDHDHFNLIDKKMTLTPILWAALREGPIKLSDDMQTKLRMLLVETGSLEERAAPDIKQLVDSIRRRTQKLIETGVLT